MNELYYVASMTFWLALQFVSNIWISKWNNGQDKFEHEDSKLNVMCRT